MLDLLISYFNFLILSIKYIVKILTFRVPDPSGYISVKEKDDFPEEIQFINERKPALKYKRLDFRLIDYDYVILKDNNNICFPLLIFNPPNHYPLCIIYCHGNSCDLGTSLLECYDITINTNCIVVNFEYPGYGICKNQPLSEIETYSNLQKTYLFVRQNLGYSPKQIVVYGFSLGTAIAFDLACNENFPIAGLILQSPILSCVRVLYNVKHTYFFDIFNNCDKAKYLKASTFFIHGNKDTLVPYIHGRILAKIIPQEYLYDFFTVDGADHNYLFKINEKLTYEKIRKFIEICTGFTSMNTSKCNNELTENVNTIENESANMKNLNNSAIIKSNFNLNLAYDKLLKFYNYNINNSKSINLYYLPEYYKNYINNNSSSNSNNNLNINSTKGILIENKELQNNPINNSNINSNEFYNYYFANLPFARTLRK